MLLYLGIALFLSIVFPFQIALIILLIVLISLNIIRAERRLRKAGVGGIKGWYKSFSSSATSNDSAYNSLKFRCMNCGNEHNKIACPKCGSKAVKAG
ncbi:MAG: hypothetical protein WB706_03705 [Nitrososphaeraceae archaeon]